MREVSKMIWVEKYRPKTFDEVLGLPPEIKESINDNMTHMLFFGSPGTGKTTTAKIIISVFKADNLVLNASDERGIDIIREKVKTFAMTQSINGKFKIIHLDEADMLTKEAQNSLRNLMETYSKNCRFILTCNHITKIEPALQSRCSCFEFKMPNNGVALRLKQIADNEGVKVSDDVIDKIIEVSKNDIRKCVNILQSVSSNKKLITINDIKSPTEYITKIHELLINNNFLSARQIFLDANAECDEFLVDYHDYLMSLREKLGITKLANAIIILADALSKMNVISREIIVEAAFIKLIGVLK